MLSGATVCPPWWRGDYSGGGSDEHFQFIADLFSDAAGRGAGEGGFFVQISEAVDAGRDVRGDGLRCVWISRGVDVRGAGELSQHGPEAREDRAGIYRRGGLDEHGEIVFGGGAGGAHLYGG